MNRQALVIGLGQFGMSLVRSLSELSVDVLAVDRRTDLTRIAAEVASEAATFDATDEAALARAAPERRDVCICAIGAEARDAAIMCTALLRQMGAKRLIARANDPALERILRLVGAHEVVNPEREFGQRLAAHLAHEGVVGEYPLSAGIIITELRVPPPFVGRTLIELALPRRFGVTIVAIQRGPETLPAPDPKGKLRSDDLLVLVSKTGAVAEMMDRID